METTEIEIYTRYKGGINDNDKRRGTKGKVRRKPRKKDLF